MDATTITAAGGPAAPAHRAPSHRAAPAPGGPAPVPVAPPGLKGLVVADTALGDVRGAEGFYHYGPYSAVELAGRRRFEDVWFLFVHGRLPGPLASAAFAAEVAAARELPDGLLDLLAPLAARATSPLGALRSALSVTADALGLRPLLDIDERARRADALRLAAVVPTLVATLHRLRAGEEPVAPSASLGHVADLLRMLEGREPAPEVAAALETYLVLTLDHGFNASTFTARVVASTGADLGACVVGALGALSGPLHGGAPSRALDLLDAIATPDRAGAVVRERLDAGERIMGFGHAVYQGEDPRSRCLRDVALRLGGPRADLAVATEAAVVDELARRRPDRSLQANVEYYAAVVMEACGLPPELFTSTFAVSRTVGWTAHALEQAGTGRLIRPSARYVGPPAPTPVPEP